MVEAMMDAPPGIADAPRRAAWRAPLAVGLLAFGLASIAALSLWVSAPARLVSIGGFAEGNTLDAPGTLRAVGDLWLCVDRHGSTATVTRVTPVEARGDLEIQDFAVRPYPFPDQAIGMQFGSLSDLGFTGNRVVSADCTSGKPDELAVEIRRTSPGVAGSRAFLVDYMADGIPQSVTIDVRFSLCGAGQTTAGGDCIGFASGG